MTPVRYVSQPFSNIRPSRSPILNLCLHHCAFLRVLCDRDGLCAFVDHDDQGVARLCLLDQGNRTQFGGCYYIVASDIGYFEYCWMLVLLMPHIALWIGGVANHCTVQNSNPLLMLLSFVAVTWKGTTCSLGFWAEWTLCAGTCLSSDCVHHPVILHLLEVSATGSSYMRTLPKPINLVTVPAMHPSQS